MKKNCTTKQRAGIMIAAFFLLANIFCLSLPLQAEATDRLMMGTTSTASSHYTYSVAASNAINSVKGEKMIVTTVATGGGVDNLERLDRGQIDFGIGTFAAFYQAYEGMGEYVNDARPKLRIMYLYSVNANNFIVRADSGVDTLQDLHGRRYCPGLRGSSGEQLVEQIFNSLDIEPDYYRGGLADAVNAVRDRQIVGLSKAGAGLALDASTEELRATTRLKILDFKDDDITALEEKMPFLNIADVSKDDNPYGPYRTPVQSIGVVTNKDILTDEQVYDILEAITEDRQAQEAAYPQLKGFDFGKETLTYANFPLHAGAVRYYRDAGYDVPEHLIPPEMK